MSEPRNAGRRVISQADADAITAKSGVQKPVSAAKPKGGWHQPARDAGDRDGRLDRAVHGCRAGVYHLARSGGRPIPRAGCARPAECCRPAIKPIRWPAASPTRASRPAPSAASSRSIKRPADFTLTDDPLLVADGKFFVVKVAPDATVQPAPDEDGNVNADNIMAIYQVCVHLGCLVPYIPSEKRFICPCHGSTYERDTQYVRGPAPRNLDQFPVKVVNGKIVVNTGLRKTGNSHA